MGPGLDCLTLYQQELSRMCSSSMEQEDSEEKSLPSLDARANLRSGGDL
jgi:hypothetical protein